MDTSNIFRFNGIDPFDNWTIKDGCLYGYYPRNSFINMISKSKGPFIEEDRIIIPKDVKEIRGSCFRNNQKYTEVVVPITVKKVSEDAFRNSNITIVVTKGSYIEEYAIRKCLKYRVK